MTDSSVSGQSSVATPPADFRTLFDEHVGYVWNTLRRLGVPDADRDDVTQEVFLTVHSLLDDYDPTRPMRPWLFGIAYRVTLRHRRGLTRRREVLDARVATVVDQAPSAERMLVAKQTRTMVMAAIDRIELHRRAVFILKELDGHDVPEIAESLGIPLNTAYSRLRLARDEFREAVRRLRAGERGAP